MLGLKKSMVAYIGNVLVDFTIIVLRCNGQLKMWLAMLSVSNLQHHQVGGIIASSSSHKVNSNQTQIFNHVISHSPTRKIPPFNRV